jgi:hypothetical protein
MRAESAYCHSGKFRKEGKMLPFSTNIPLSLFVSEDSARVILDGFMSLLRVSNFTGSVVQSQEVT